MFYVSCWNETCQEWEPDSSHHTAKEARIAAEPFWPPKARINKFDSEKMYLRWLNIFNARLELGRAEKAMKKNPMSESACADVSAAEEYLQRVIGAK